MKERVTGIWRSYKIFLFSGRVEWHNATTYLELSVDKQGVLTLVNSQNRRKATTYAAQQWHIDPIKKYWFIYLGKRQAYEIITLEKEEMVLMDTVRGEKIFFAKLPVWHRCIEPVKTEVRHTRRNNESSNH